MHQMTQYTPLCPAGIYCIVKSSFFLTELELSLLRAACSKVDEIKPPQTRKWKAKGKLHL